MINSEQIINDNRKIIMGLSMIFIIIFHLWKSYPANMSSPLTDWTIGFGHLGNEIFFFLAGMGCFYSYIKNDLKTYFKHRLRRFLLPCILAGLIKIFLFPQYDPISFIIHILSFDQWFIVAYLVLAFTGPLFFRILLLNKGKLSPFIILIILYNSVLIFSDILIPDIPNSFFHITKRGFMTFAIGAWLACNYSYRRDLLKKFPLHLHIIWIIFVLLLFITNIHLNSDSLLGYSIRGAHNYYIWLAFGCPSFIYCISYFFHKKHHLLLTQFLSFTGTITLELYLFHEFFFAVLRQSPGVNTCFFLAAVSMVTLSFLVAWSFHYMINKIPEFILKNEK